MSAHACMDHYCWLAVSLLLPFFRCLRKVNVCRKRLNYSVVETVLKIIKSSRSVFKHLNISKTVSVLNFLYIFILLIDHRTVSFRWMFLAVSEKLQRTRNYFAPCESSA